MYILFAEIRVLHSNLTLEEIQDKEAKLIGEVNQIDILVKVFLSGKLKYPNIS